MIRRQTAIALVLAASWMLADIGTANAQGLLWSLPEDGRAVRFEGDFRQVEFRPDSAQGDLELTWKRNLTLRSVGQEMAEFGGKNVPCRWIEIKVETGKETDTGLDTGPIGARLYKVLVPESRVIAKQHDADSIPHSFIPIVKGYRRNEDNESEEIQSKVLQVYPLFAFVRHFEKLEGGQEPEDLDILGRTVAAQKWVGKSEKESLTSRSVSESTLWRSSDVHFGLAKWSVKMTRYAKDQIAARSEFRPVSEVTVEMSAVQEMENAQSELATP